MNNYNQRSSLLLPIQPSYTILPDCFDVVNTETNRQQQSIEKGRSYSAIIGSLSPTESLFPSSVATLLREESEEEY